jgi:hypothetical protein
MGWLFFRCGSDFEYDLRSVFVAARGSLRGPSVISIFGFRAERTFYLLEAVALASVPSNQVDSSLGP